MYKVAYETFQKGDVEGARKKFEAFLNSTRTPNSPATRSFGLERPIIKKGFEKAILEYEKAITKYPEGSKVPAALYKQGLAFLELGDKANARNLFKRVIERIPVQSRRIWQKGNWKRRSHRPVSPKQSQRLLLKRKPVAG